MSNIIDFTKFGGFRLEQPTLKKMQETYYLFLKALVGHLGVPDEGHFIISGCNIEGENITEGILYIDGHVCEFPTTAGTLATKIVKVTTTQTLSFQNGTTPLVFTTYKAAVNNAGTALSEFVRVPSPFNLPANIVIDANYVSTENNFSDAWIEFLMSIEYGAEKNVQPDWNVFNDTLDNFIKNKPFKKIQHVYGQMTVSSFFETNNPAINLENNTDYNYGYIFPPAGFEITDLAGFIPSINKVYFRNTVNGDDTLYCNYQIDVPNDRVIVICSNSESRTPATFNYLAIWIKN